VCSNTGRGDDQGQPEGAILLVLDRAIGKPSLPVKRIGVVERDNRWARSAAYI